MNKSILEPQRQIPVVGDYDVAVVGGGVAGIAAALSAARAGAKTVLLERQYALGGLATLGLVNIYLPLCDGCGRQVSFACLFVWMILHRRFFAGRKPKPKPGFSAPLIPISLRFWPKNFF